MFRFLTRASILWTLFGITIALTLSLELVQWYWQFELIDFISTPYIVGPHIAAMSETQRSVHIWTTAVLDVAYPFAYCALLAGLTLRGLPGFFTLPALFTLLADLAEGAVQIELLSGNADLFAAKEALTPLKFTLFFIAIGIALLGSAIAWHKSRKRASNSGGR